MMWVVLIGLLIMVVVLRTWAALGIGICRKDEKKERYIEELIRNSEYTEN